MNSVITEDYRRLNAHLHATRPDYGSGGGEKWAELVRTLADKYGARSVLDYGCGKGTLKRALVTSGLDVRNYDPAIEEWANTPEPADIVACNDVLEHIEPDCLDAVLDDLRRVTKRVGVFTIAMGPAKKTLTDGRNAHLIQEPIRWWLPRLCARFEPILLQREARGYSFLVWVEPS